MFFPPGASDWLRDVQAYALFAVAYFGDRHQRAWSASSKTRDAEAAASA